MRAEHVWAATTITHGGVEGVLEPLDVKDGKDGQPVGLAGFTGKRDFHCLDKEVVKRVEGGAKSFVVHPAAVGFSLGEDALLVDAVPFNFRTELERNVTRRFKAGTVSGGEQELRTFRNWLFDDDRSTYKFIDVPMTIDQSPSGVVYAARTDDGDGKWPASLRRQAFLTFQKLDSPAKGGPRRGSAFLSHCALID